MKYFFYLIIILCSSNQLFAQNAAANIETDFSTYTRLLEEKKYDSSLNFVVEDFFTIFSRETFAGILKMTYAISAEMGIEQHQPQLTSIDSVEKIDTQYFSILVYNNLMTIPYDPEDDDESEKAKAKNIKKMMKAYEGSFGEGNVKFNVDEDQFEINNTSRVCCVSKNGEDDWKFVTLNPSQKNLLSRFLPNEIISKM